MHHSTTWSWNDSSWEKKIDLYRMTHQICIHFNKESACKGHLFIFNHCIDMRTSVSLSISCRKNVFLLKFSNKNTFFPHEMDKIMVVLKSIKTLNKERRPLAIRWDLFFIFEKTLNKYLGLYIWTQIWNPQLKPRWFDIKKNF